MLPKSKMYKVLDKNIIEKRKKNHYTSNRERVIYPEQKILIMEETHMKKIIALVLALVMVMGLVACGNTAPETTAPIAGE